MSVITLLTDFGYQDPYVGVMKGIIATIAPQTTVIDLNHNISPQDIWSARFNLLTSFEYFPQGTVHVAVVDPGVGTARRAIAVQFAQGYFVAPDNGLLSDILTSIEQPRIVTLTNKQYWRTSQPSQTFHGRDIFAPVAAYLAKGLPLDYLGSPIDFDSLVHQTLPATIRSENTIQGIVQYIDRFGNSITNVPANQLPQAEWMLSVHHHQIGSQLTYGSVNQGQALSLIGSHGWVEIAINGGNAAQELDLQVGTTVTLNL